MDVERNPGPTVGMLNYDSDSDIEDHRELVINELGVVHPIVTQLRSFEEAGMKITIDRIVQVAVAFFRGDDNEERGAK